MSILASHQRTLGRLRTGAMARKQPALAGRLQMTNKTTGPRRASRREIASPRPLGARRWVIAEGYIPLDDGKKPRPLLSHETACILNANAVPAHITITLYFADRAPVGPYCVDVAAQRTLHLRFNELTEPAPVPHNTDFSSIIESDVPIVVQHTRLDSRTPARALLTTIAYPAD